MGAPPDEEKDDRALRRELRALSSRTPAPGERFTDAVMHRVALRPRPRPRSLWAALTRPRELTFRFRLSQLVSLGAAAGLVAVFLLRAHLPPTVAPAHAPRIAIAAPEGNPAHAPVLIRFALSAHAARAVSVAGDFNGWRPEATPLTRGPDGVWTVTVPLAPGSWAYSFIVDGKFVEDPLAEAWRDDGFGGKNAILRIGG
ncbi:MAG TPA: isoamylase early set domain-containing protein [Polyangia bacterium]|jgi:hypothetical protein